MEAYEPEEDQINRLKIDKSNILKKIISGDDHFGFVKRKIELE